MKTGLFVVADGHCAHSDDDPAQLTPPFSGCREDDDLWRDPGD